MGTENHYERCLFKEAAEIVPNAQQANVRE